MATSMSPRRMWESASPFSDCKSHPHLLEGPSASTWPIGWYQVREDTSTGPGFPLQEAKWRRDNTEPWKWWQDKPVVIVPRSMHSISFKAWVQDCRQGSISRCYVWGCSKMHIAPVKYFSWCWRTLDQILNRDFESQVFIMLMLLQHVHFWSSCTKRPLQVTKKFSLLESLGFIISFHIPQKLLYIEFLGLN